MLLVLLRPIVTRSFPATLVRFSSSRPTGTQDNHALIQEKSDEASTHREGPRVVSEQSLPNTSWTQERPESSSTAETSSSSASDTHDSGKGLSSYDLEVVKQRIREWTDQAAITLRERADGFTSHTKTTFSRLGAHLNKVTGYEEIEALKREVAEQEEKIKITRQAAKQAKIAYEQAVIQRSNSQREVNELLQRKSLWTDSDVSRFTSIVRQDHLYEQEEIRAKAAVDETDAAVEREFTRLMKSILARYHEEQVWSDKIRSASTYGSLAALGLNLIVFILAIVVVEPWKRRRLAQTFEKKIEEMSMENAMRLEASLKVVGEQFVEQENLLSQVLEGVNGSKRAMDAEGRDGNRPVQVVERIPAGVAKPAVFSVPGVSLTLPQRTFELAAVGVGAFVLGVIGTILLD